MVPEIEPTELSRALASVVDAPILVDVREPEEHELCSIKPSILIPLMQLPDRLAEIRKLSGEGTREIVVYCRSGQRSALAIQFLFTQSVENLRNLRGGINAYAREADPTITPY